MLTVLAATPTPTVVIPTPTATQIPTPPAGQIGLGVTGPAPGQQVNPGNSLTLSIHQQQH